MYEFLDEKKVIGLVKNELIGLVKNELRGKVMTELKMHSYLKDDRNFWERSV